MAIKNTESEFRDLSYAFDKELKKLNPSGGIKVFLRLAVEFGYNQALIDVKKGPPDITSSTKATWITHICTKCGGTMTRTTYKTNAAKKCVDCGSIKVK